MSQTMKIKKGDVVHVLRGKDAGKEGRVIEALPKEGRVVVENVNMIKRHQRPRPIQNSSQMGGAQIIPGGIVEKPANELGRRQERRGVVVSDAMDKTIVVKVELIKIHPRYKKVIRRSVKFHAHDEQNQAGVGDIVRIVETRPLSATKHWRLAEIVEVAK